MKLKKLNSLGFEHTIVMAAIVVGVAIGGTYLLVFSHAASNIIDVSYPQCDIQNSLGRGRVGIIGVNGGGDFVGNPCLAGEIKHFSHYELYANTNYPSSGCPTPSTNNAAKNCGYKVGQWAYHYAITHGAYASTWWVDVEEGPGIPWSGNKILNRNFLYGMLKGLQSKGVRSVGYYSTGPQWNSITGGWHSGNLGWYATGATAQTASVGVRDYCHKSFTGGPVRYVQYIRGNLDTDVRC